jgi:two-component system, NarL family, nitrate/nitrite response regulator NarL
MIDVLVGDSEPMFLDGLARAIRQDSELQLVAGVADGPAALAAIREHRPAVALLSHRLGELSGDRILAAVVRDALPTRILLLEHTPADAVWDALRGGAAGVLSRRVAADAIRAAVRTAAGGGTALCEDAQAAVAGEIRARRPSEEPLLTPREREILALIADGWTAPEIAAELHLAITTVRTHIQHLLEKLHARDRAQLIHHAMRKHLLD